MKILAFDTATEACSVALNVDGEVYQLFELTPRAHTSRLLPMIEQVLAEAQISVNHLDAIAFGRGPGMFTGLRIAAAAAQALAFGANIPVLPVSSLLALAFGAHQKFGFETILAAIDARMGQVYANTYHFEHNQIKEGEEEKLLDLVELQCLSVGHYGVGSGCEVFQSDLKQLAAVQLGCFPEAGAIVQLAAEMLRQNKGVPPELALPVYIRDKVT